MPCTLTHIAPHEDEEDADPPPVQRVVSAMGQPLPKTSGFVSVFDMAAMSRHLPPLKLSGFRISRDESTGTRIQDACHLVIERDVGRVTVRRVHYLETQEWKDKEAARRARQVLPKPPKQEFRMGKHTKVLQEA